MYPKQKTDNVYQTLYIKCLTLELIQKYYPNCYFSDLFARIKEVKEDLFLVITNFSNN